MQTVEDYASFCNVTPGLHLYSLLLVCLLPNRSCCTNALRLVCTLGEDMYVVYAWMNG